jgi:single-stranded-DNA-specific exonuclease
MTIWLDPPETPIPDFLRDEHPLVARTLVRRGMTTPEAARAFLDPAQYSPRPASDIPGLEAAAERVLAAICKGESICVWGDFDVDGQTSTTLLVETLRALGADVSYHIPVRARESHGVRVEFLAPVIDQGAQLILTCDTGISAHEAVDYARARGVDMVITDHHDLPPELPNAAAVVDPKLLPGDHPLATLPGVGVAYKLAEMLLSLGPAPSPSGKGEANEVRQGEGEPLQANDLLDLVALGIVADVATQQGDTRYLLQLGLETLRNTQRLGLQTIFNLSNLQPANLTEEHIGFVLGPRLNAIGRLGDANPVVELLTTSDPVRARVLAAQLEGLNAQRQLLTNQVYQAAEAQLREDPSLLAQPVIVLAHPSWPGGVIGIAASRLVERYQRPTILLSAPEGEPARGSARSVEGVNITTAIAAQEELLLGFGGHPMAAGMSLETDKIPDFRRGLARSIERMFGPPPEATLQIDAWLPLSEQSLKLVDTLEKLAPFGAGNPAPLLATRKLSLKSSQKIGKNGDHVKLGVTDESGETREILWWNGGMEEPPAGKFDLAYRLRASDYRGQRQVQAELVDFRVVEEAPVEVTPPKLEVIDHRQAQNALAELQALPAGTLVWAEGAHKAEVGSLSREQLSPADSLAIWTTPPGNAELQAALETVKPRTVHLFAVNPQVDQPEAFLQRLAGLAKYALNQKGGQVRLSELAAAAAQREIMVRLGLEWLAAGGHLGFGLEDGQIDFSAEKREANPYLQAELFTALKGLLAETAAYREHFVRADAESLVR